MEKITIPEKNKYNDLILNIKELGGGDFEYIKWIISDLEKNDPDSARVNCEQQRDKFDNKPEIKELLKKALWENGEDSPWPTKEEFKRRVAKYE